MDGMLGKVRSRENIVSGQKDIEAWRSTPMYLSALSDDLDVQMSLSHHNPPA